MKNFFLFFSNNIDHILNRFNAEANHNCNYKPYEVFNKTYWKLKNVGRNCHYTGIHKKCHNEMFKDELKKMWSIVFGWSNFSLI